MKIPYGMSNFVDIRQGRFGCLFAQGGSFRARHMICQFGGESGGFDFSRGNQSRHARHHQY